MALVVAAMSLASFSASDPAVSESPAFSTEQVRAGDLAESVSFSGVLTYDAPFYVVYQKTTTATMSASGGGPSGSGRGVSTATVASDSTGIVTWVVFSSSFLHIFYFLYLFYYFPFFFL